mmetsp:Transcript_51464/g.145036  ORF Transcript_51464/g.145036 Transcript_51464/m.145036 type:complete len:386 (+) Transcript_51464:561-1718(+)
MMTIGRRTLLHNNTIHWRAAIEQEQVMTQARCPPPAEQISPSLAAVRQAAWRPAASQASNQATCQRPWRPGRSRRGLTAPRRRARRPTGSLDLKPAVTRAAVCHKRHGPRPTRRPRGSKRRLYESQRLASDFSKCRCRSRTRASSTGRRRTSTTGSRATRSTGQRSRGSSKTTARGCGRRAATATCRRWWATSTSSRRCGRTRRRSRPPRGRRRGSGRAARGRPRRRPPRPRRFWSTKRASVDPPGTRSASCASECASWIATVAILHVYPRHIWPLSTYLGIGYCRVPARLRPAPTRTRPATIERRHLSKRAHTCAAPCVYMSSCAHALHVPKFGHPARGRLHPGGAAPAGTRAGGAAHVRPRRPKPAGLIFVSGRGRMNLWRLL